MAMTSEEPGDVARGPQDPREPVALLLRDLRTRPGGLAAREAARRLVVHGPNELTRRGRKRWPHELAGQFTQPLALLWVAAALALVDRTPALSVAIVAVITLNAVFAFVQEQEAERSVEALARFLPAQAKTIRDGHRQSVDARDLVPGDVLIVEEGDRVSADARLLEGSVEIDMSTLNGESQPAYRSAELVDTTGPLLDARDLLFGADTTVEGRERHRRRQFHFDPALRLMSTVDQFDDQLWVHSKGAPEDIVARATQVVGADHPISSPHRSEIASIVAGQAAQGLRLIAVARRRLDHQRQPAGRHAPCPAGRWQAGVCSTMSGYRPRP